VRDIGIEYPAKGEVRFYDLGPAPGPSPTQILIETRYSGITNGTERHGLTGDFGWGHYPGRHGYQHVGQVISAGADVKQFAVGDWVFYGNYVGHRGWHIVEIGEGEPSPTDTHLTVKLPLDVKREDCALLGVAGVGLRGIKRIRTAPGHKVWVAGAGPIGNFSAQSARVKGADVTGTDMVPHRLEVARQTGAHRTFLASDEGAWEALKNAGPFDRIVDACSAESLFYDIARNGLLARSGVIAAMAVRGEVRYPWGMLHGTEASIEVACHFSLEDQAELIGYVQRGEIQIAPLVSHRVPIDGAPEIYATLRDRPGDLLGVVFDWG
jgi:2-desacetyl-2-hydroxyethyl bacteriochlorophyllide A dehydrogenase